MLMAISLGQAQNSFFRRWRQKLRGEDLQWRYAAYAGNRYLNVTWFGTAETIPWARVAAIPVRSRGGVLLPEGAVIPPQSTLHAYEPQDFYARLTVSAVCGCLRDTPEIARRATVGVIDPAGVAAWACMEIAPWCRSIRVYTLRPERYTEQEQMLLEEHGVPLLYADTPRELRGCALCAAPYPTGVFAVPSAVVTPDRSGIQGRPTVNRLSLLISEEQRTAVPRGLCPELFFGALAETGFHRFPLEYTVDQCRIDGRLARMHDVLAPIGKSFVS